MKGFRGTFIFAVLVAVVGIFALREYKNSEKEAGEKNQQGQVFLGYKTDDVSDFSFQGKEARFSLHKENNQWRIMSPITDRANKDSVEGMIHQLFTENAVEVESEGQIDWNKYGFNPPLAFFEIKLTDKRTLKLAVGSVRTYDSGFYLRRNDENKLLVGTHTFAAALSHKLMDLRAKDLIVPEGDLVGLRISYASNEKKAPYSITFLKTDKDSKADKDWTSLNSRWHGPWSDPAFSSLLQSVRDLKGQNIVADQKTPEELKKYGLVKPNIDMKLTIKGADKKTSDFELTASAPKDGKIFYTSSNYLGIFQVASARFDGFRKTDEDFLDKGFPFRFKLAEATQLAIQKKGDTKAVEFIKKDGQWNLKDAISEKSAEKSTEKSADSRTIANLVTKLDSMTANSFSNENPKKFNSENTITVKDANNKILLALSVGDKIKNGKTEIHLAKSSLMEGLVTLTPEQVNQIFAVPLTEEKDKKISAAIPALNTKTEKAPPPHPKKEIKAQ